MLENLDTIVLDLDGTLVDSAPDLAHALNTILEKHGGHPAHSVSAVRNMIGAGVPKLIERGLRAHGADSSPEVVESLLPDMLAYYTDNATNETNLYPGAENLLRFLKGRGIAVALCTNKPTEVTKVILHNLGVEDYFDIVIGGTSGFPKKPDPASLLSIMSELGTTPERTGMVGDSGHDVESARNAGLKKVAVMSYGYTKTPAQELGADLVFDSFDELVSLMSQDSAEGRDAGAEART